MRTERIIDQLKVYMDEVMQEYTDRKPGGLMDLLQRNESLAPTMKFIDVYSERMDGVLNQITSSLNAAVGEEAVSYDSERTLGLMAFVLGAMPYFQDNENPPDEFVTPIEFFGEDAQAIAAITDDNKDIMFKYDPYLINTLRSVNNYLDIAFNMYELAKKDKITQGSMGRIQLLANMIIGGMCMGRAIASLRNVDTADQDYPYLSQYFRTIQSWKID